MRIIGIERPGRQREVAWLRDDGRTVSPIAELQAFWREPQRWLERRDTGGSSLPANRIRRVPPVLPDARVLCVGLNYPAHAAEGSYGTQALPSHPTIFARFVRSLSVDGASLPVPVDEEGLDWEGEVMAWVGTRLVDASSVEAQEAVIGYSAFNDVTARRAQKRTSQWTLGKNADATGVLGPMTPAAEVGDLARGLAIRTRVNGQLVQEGSTRDMIYPVGPTLAHISRTITLEPGDLLATGTPAGVGYARKSRSTGWARFTTASWITITGARPSVPDKAGHGDGPKPRK